MGGTAVAGQLTAPRHQRIESTVRFEVATPDRDQAVRRLLRDNPIPGRISISLERDPSYFAAAAVEGPEHQTIVALEGDHVIAAGSVSARPRFINGAPIRVGYLGGLRMDASIQGRASIIRRGYTFFRQLHEQGGPRIYLTSIVADNQRARRFLERGLQDMPTYRFLGDFITLIIRVRSPESIKLVHRLQGNDESIVCGSEESRSGVWDLLNRDLCRYQFAPVWSANELQPADFRIVCSRAGCPVACAALWDQRSFKQIIVRGYAPRLRRARPLINLGASLLSRPGLPRIGESIPHAFVSHVAADTEEPDALIRIIRALMPAARDRGIEYLTLGFDARDPRLAQLRNAFRPREYSSRLYAVHWEDGMDLAQSLDDRLMAPEVALL
ncbi:MAG TPA: hypothetical protein VFV34_08310 [Blastocatellia bacterium]|nr:hypothetical protein [Blastocatellia bacterium]